MSAVLDRLASALGRNDEQPNVELAMALCESGDAAAIAELAAALQAGKRPVQHDAIKVLYEIGERRPELVAPYAEAFFAALASPSNRLVWGGLSGLASIVGTVPGVLAARLPEIMAAAEAGSVIAKDKAVAILAVLARSGHAAVALPLLIGQVQAAAVNQLPSYAEAAQTAVDDVHKAVLVAAIAARLPEVPQPAKRARLEKVLKKLARSP